MLKSFGISEQLQPRLGRVEKKVTNLYDQGTYKSEDRITGHLTGLLSTELDCAFKSGSDEVLVDVTAFEGTNEPESGIDMGLRYQVATEEFHLSTGIVAQCKRFGKSDPLLRHQCYKMLTRTQEAYIFTYSQDEIGVLPALPVYSDQGTGGKYTKYYHRGFVPFLSRFLEGYYGDLTVANTIDQPADAFPVPERVRYLVDIRAQVNQHEAEFNLVNRDRFKQISSEDQY